MEEERKNKFKNFFIWAGLGALILFVVITGIVLHAKSEKYNQLKDDNESIKNSEEIVSMIDFEN